MQSWLELASSGPVVRRALGYALVVGALLVAINHGDTIVRGELQPTQLVKIAMTVVVPYMVSTLSSVQAIRESGSKD